MNNYKQTKRYRVLESTYNPCEKTRAMIGGIFEEKTSFSDDKTIALWNKDKSDYGYFNPSDVQELTNVIVDGYEIGIGDVVIDMRAERYEVYDYLFYDNKWRVYAWRKDKKPFEYCLAFNAEDIVTVIPKKEITKPIMSEEEMIKHLKRAGRIKDGQIIN